MSNQVTANELYIIEIFNWIRDSDINPIDWDWEKVIGEYLCENYSEEIADNFADQVLDLFGVYFSRYLTTDDGS